MTISEPRNIQAIPPSWERVLPTESDEEPEWFLAISSGKGGLDGWRMMAIDDTGRDLWTVAWAWEELEGSGVAV